MRRVFSSRPTRPEKGSVGPASRSGNKHIPTPGRPTTQPRALDLQRSLRLGGEPAGRPPLARRLGALSPHWLPPCRDRAEALPPLFCPSPHSHLPSGHVSVGPARPPCSAEHLEADRWASESSPPLQRHTRPPCPLLSNRAHLHLC